MDFGKLASAVLVLALAVAIILGAIAGIIYVVKPADQPKYPVQPTLVYQPYYYCPRCNTKLEPTPNMPKPETFPQYPLRPGSQTGNLGDKGAADSKSSLDKGSSK